jgi:hypothetical protein
MNKRAYTTIKNKAYQNFETIGTILWLLTDFIWMCGFVNIAAILTLPTLFFMIGSCIKFTGNKKSELLSLTASAGWLLMNSCWIYSEITEKETYLLCAKLSFMFASFFVYLSIRAAKKEGQPTDFKRLKIK